MQETLSYRANFVFHYLNANNLYVWKRIQKLATHEFAWKNFMIPLLKKNPDKLLEKDRQGYIVEVV